MSISWVCFYWSIFDLYIILVSDNCTVAMWDVTSGGSWMKDLWDPLCSLCNFQGIKNYFKINIFLNRETRTAKNRSCRLASPRKRQQDPQISCLFCLSWVPRLAEEVWADWHLCALPNYASDDRKINTDLRALFIFTFFHFFPFIFISWRLITL